LPRARRRDNAGNPTVETGGSDPGSYTPDWYEPSFIPLTESIRKQNDQPKKKSKDMTEQIKGDDRGGRPDSSSSAQ
jgi:hypothetical protein